MILGLLVLSVHWRFNGASNPATGQLAARTRCRAVHHGGDGRPRDTHVHQQRDSWHSRNAPAMAEKFALGSVLLLLWPICCSWTPHSSQRLRWPAPSRTAVRLYLWQPWRTFATPLVWVLHAAYAWIVAHLALRGLSELGLISGSLATHALTIGAIGGLTIGMMTRTARGHTARPLQADGFDIASYLFCRRRQSFAYLAACWCPGFILRASSYRACSGPRHSCFTRFGTGQC